MGQVSTLEDIQERIDDALVRLPSIPAIPDEKRGSISRESLLDTNDLLRSRNDELLKLLYAVKMDIESKINQSFCKAECVRLRETNDWLRRRLETLGNDKVPTSKDKDPAPHQPEKGELVPQDLRGEAKRRYHDAEKAVAAAEKELKQAKKARVTAQNEFQALHQSERNSTKHVHDIGHGRRQ